MLFFSFFLSLLSFHRVGRLPLAACAKLPLLRTLLVPPLSPKLARNSLRILSCIPFSESICFLNPDNVSRNRATFCGAWGRHTTDRRINWHTRTEHNKNRGEPQRTTTTPHHHFPLLRFRSVAIVRPFPGPFLEIFDVRNVALLSTPFFQTRWSIFSPLCRPPFGARAWSIHSTYDTAAEI